MATIEEMTKGQSAREVLAGDALMTLAFDVLAASRHSTGPTLAFLGSQGDQVLLHRGSPQAAITVRRTDPAAPCNSIVADH